MKTKLYFRKSSRYSCLYHLFTFAFTLACGYIVSLALDAAIASQESAVYGRAAVLGVILLIGLPILYVFARGTKKQKELDAQAYREALYRKSWRIGYRYNIPGSWMCGFIWMRAP